MEDTARILVSSGADVIQLRMKSDPDRDYLLMAEKISSICRDNNALFIVNDRIDIAMLSGAHGVHLGQDDIPLVAARSISGGGLITGISVCNADEASAAADADYIAVGPVFQTSSKDGALLEGVGLDIVRDICRLSDKPVAAIGGITESNAGLLIETGVSSLSVISALYKNGRVLENTRRLNEIIKSYSGKK